MTYCNKQKSDSSESHSNESSATAVKWLIDTLGNPRSQLSTSFIKALCVWNGILAYLQFLGEYRDRSLFKTPAGETKVASLSIMNKKYSGIFRACLYTHIASGAIAQIGSSVGVLLEDIYPSLSRWFSKIASTSEAYFHAPTAFFLSPYVYGDKGITPYVYGVVSFLLQISSLSALEESNSVKAGVRPELRRMCTTISIFLYVRLYALMRGVGGIIHKQKYSLAVMTAGAAMMPVGWRGEIFPSVFWMLLCFNRSTVQETLKIIYDSGLDEAYKKQLHLS